MADTQINGVAASPIKSMSKQYKNNDCPSQERDLAQIFYESNNQSVQTLNVVSHGIVDDNNNVLFDESKAPWANAKLLLYHLSSMDYKAEKLQRWKLDSSAKESLPSIKTSGHL